MKTNIYLVATRTKGKIESTLVAAFHVEEAISTLKASRADAADIQVQQCICMATGVLIGGITLH